MYYKPLYKCYTKDSIGNICGVDPNPNENSYSSLLQCYNNSDKCNLPTKESKWCCNKRNIDHVGLVGTCVQQSTGYCESGDTIYSSFEECITDSNNSCNIPKN